MMRKMCTILLATVLLLLCAPCALAGTLPDFTAERTGYGMELDFDGSAITVDGKVICAAYDAEGRLLAAELLPAEDAAELTLYCDVNQVRGMKLFAVNEAFKPLAEASATQLSAPEAPIHLHTWNKTPDETTPATCTDAGLQIFHCTGCADGDLEHVLPPLEHQWGSWTYVDANLHTSVCMRDAEHTLSASHNWDNGVVTLEPTEAATGTKIYTCGDCGGTKTEELPAVTANHVWFRQSYSSYYLCWTPVEVPAGQYYYVNGTCTYSTSSEKYMNLELQNLTQSTDITIGMGNNSVGVTTLYTLPNALRVASLPAETYTLTGQESGTYLVRPSNSSDTFVYTFTDPDGLKIASGSSSPALAISPWDGCQVTLSRTVTTLSADTFSITVQRSPDCTVTAFEPYTPTSDVQEVSTAAQLKSALLSGGTVRLMNDLADVNGITLNTGAPATLDLNGHQLSDAYFHIRNGKELTILGTTEGSAITYDSSSTISVFSGCKLILDGGTYGSISVNASGGSPCREVTIRNARFTTDGDQRTALSFTNAAAVTLTDVTATSAYAVVNAHNCGPVTISGGSYTCTFASDTNSTSAIYFTSCGDVSITDTTVSSTFKGINLYSCGDVLVDGCTLSTTALRQSLTYCLELSNCGDVTVSNTHANAISRLFHLYNSKAVNVSNCTLTADYMENLPGTALEVSGNTSLHMEDTAIHAVIAAADLSSMDKVSVDNCTFSSSDPDSLTSYADTCVNISRIGSVGISDTSVTGEHVMSLSQCDTVSLTDSTFTGVPTQKVSTPKALNSTDSPQLVMTRVAISGDCTLSSVTELTDSTVENCTFSVYSACAAEVINTQFTDSKVYVQSGAAVTLVSGDHITSDYWLELVNGYQGTVIIQGGTFQNTENPTNVFGFGLDSSQLIITGGTFSQDPSPYVDSTVYEVQNDRDLFLVVPIGTAPKQYTAVPTIENSVFDTVTGPTLILSPLSEDQQQCIDRITLTSQIGDGMRWSCDYPASALNCRYLSGEQLTALLPWPEDNTVHITLTAHPTEAAKEEGYAAGTATFDLDIGVREDSIPYDSEGVTAKMSVSEESCTLNLSGVPPKKYYLISGYTAEGFVQTDLVYANEKGKASLAFSADPQYTQITVTQIYNIYADSVCASFKRAFYESPIAVTNVN